MRPVLIIFLFLMTGSLNSLTKKWQMSTCSPGLDGGTDKQCRAEGKTGEKFQKPWLQNLMMFTGESFCLIYYLFFVRPRERELMKRGTQEIIPGRPVTTTSSIEGHRSYLLSGGETEGGSTASGSQSGSFQGSMTGSVESTSENSRRELIPPPHQPANPCNDSKFYWVVFAVPALCDVIGTGLGGVGLLYVSASIWQMMRGSIIIFTSFFSVVFLKKKLFGYHWFGVICAVCGLGLVGLSAILAEQRTPSGTTTTSTLSKNMDNLHSQTSPYLETSSIFAADGTLVQKTRNLSVHYKKYESMSTEDVYPQEIFMGMITVQNSQQKLLIGMGFVVFSQFFSATQFVVEELFVKRFPPVQVVAGEGIFGVIYMCILLPILLFVKGNDNGSYENVKDGFYKMSQNMQLDMFILSYMVSISLFNFLGVTVTKTLSAVLRSLVDALRTVVIWGVELIIFYVFHSKQFGERWDGWYSWLRLFGFFVCLTGTLIYKEMIKVPGFQYHEEIFSLSPVDENTTNPMSRELLQNGDTKDVLNYPKAVYRDTD